MSEALRDRIAAVLANHLTDDYVAGKCDCGEKTDDGHSTHQADAVIRELGLEPQVHYDPDCDHYRYVTDWIDPQTNQRVDLP